MNRKPSACPSPTSSIDPIGVIPFPIVRGLRGHVRGNGRPGAWDGRDEHPGLGEWNDPDRTLRAKNRKRDRDRPLHLGRPQGRFSWDPQHAELTTLILSVICRANADAPRGTKQEESPMNPVGPTPAHRTAVIVVHGIGKPPPGETVDAFVAGLRSASPDLNPSGVAEVHPLPDYDRKDGQHHTFPCHVRTAAHTQKGSFTFAEVWWALSSGRPAAWSRPSTSWPTPSGWSWGWERSCGSARAPTPSCRTASPENSRTSRVLP